VQVWNNITKMIIAFSMVVGCGTSGDDAQMTSHELSARDGGEEVASFDQSLALHGDDLSSAGWAEFSLERTLQAIIDTNESVGRDSTTPSDLLAGLFAGMNVSEGGASAFLASPESGLEMLVQDIDVVGTIADVDAYEAMALFNRLDLAPADWSNCGEYRIVYEHTVGTREAWLIFEAKLRNPLRNTDGSGDPLGCKPALDFWGSLPGMSLEARAEALSRFYYEGGDGLPPVVRHAAYATSLGQVRTNHISLGGQGDPWQLREFRTDNDDQGRTVFAVDTVKGNALAEFYRSGTSTIEPSMLAQFRTMQSEYLRGFVDQGGGIVDTNGNSIPDRLEELLAPELDPSGQTPVVGGFGLSVDNQFNEFMSVSDMSDSPAQNTNPALAADGPGALFQAQIDEALAQDETTEQPVRVEHVLNRIDAQTCGGCHQTTANQEVAPGVFWPAANAFVHARLENLSVALVERFLPARQERFDAAVERFSADFHSVQSVDGNQDGVIDGADFGLVLGVWGDSCSEEGELFGDFNGDCTIDGADLGNLLGVWGRRYIPETPSTLRSLAGGGDAMSPPSELDTAARRVATARGAAQRSAALERLREARQLEEERQREMPGALVEMRPVH